MTARFHLIGPTTTVETAILPGFITDLRPAAGLGEPLSAARAAELSGLDGVAVPFDPDGLESLVTAAGLLRASRRLQVTAGFHPAIASPVYAAKLSASVQRFSANRLAWQLLVDLDPATARAHGDFLEGADRYARAEEFLTVAKGVWSARDYTYEGRFYQVLGGGLPESRSAPAFPRVYLSGTSPEALALSAAHADVHVFTAADDLGLAPAGVAAGLVLPVLAREDEQEAVLAAKQTGFAGLAGSFAEVAKTLSVLIDRGVSEFFLAPPDPVADGYLLGQHVLPLLRREQDDELRETGKEQAHVG
jgi:alkanesulfonate monooxygenase